MILHFFLDKAAEIKACLTGFKLPESKLPAWAKEVPEEVWKKQLLERISASSKGRQPPL